MTIKDRLRNVIPESVIALSRPPRTLLRHGLAAAATRTRLRRLRASGQSLFLELGPGGRPLSSPWIGIDSSGFADLTWDLRRSLPLATGSVSGIYSSHVLEHFTLTQLQNLLRECRRVLNSDGFFMCAVPNAGRYVQAFTDDAVLEELLRNAGTSEYCVTGSPMDLLNMTAYMHGQHRTMFDSGYLCGLLRNAGFAYAAPRPCDSRFDLPERDWESLYAFAGSRPFEQCEQNIAAAEPKTR
jgi:predicted SAM-dependent methyltransferase